MQKSFSNESMSESNWLIKQDAFRVEEALCYETLFTLANGYMGVRGSFEEGAQNETPGNFIAGVYNQADGLNKEIVNAPNWLALKIYGTGYAFRMNESGSPLKMDPEHLDGFQRVLDMKKGLLFRETVLLDPSGRKTMIRGYRFVSRSNVHRAGIQYEIIPLNYSGMITVESTVDGMTVNSAHNPKFKTKHLNLSENVLADDQFGYLQMYTTDNDTHIAIGTFTEILPVNADGESSVHSRKHQVFGEKSVETLEMKVTENQGFVLEKYVVTYTTRETDFSDLKRTVLSDLREYIQAGMPEEVQKHKEAYQRLWENANIEIDGNEEDDRALRFNIFHLMNCSNDRDSRASIGAKGLHGEGYWGHAYWDTEIFMLPFFIHSNPKAARALLEYRYNTLNGARKNAEANGYQGAKYPWQSADDGAEAIPPYSLDEYGEKQKLWMGLIEDHVTADIAFAIRSYLENTDDEGFMLDCGIEILIETARFWASRCIFNEETQQYEILGVIGPDEFHEHVDNNCYTNKMASYNLSTALYYIECYSKTHPDIIKRIQSALRLQPIELEHWKDISEKLLILYNEEGIIEQFSGYFKKKDHVFKDFDENNMPVLNWDVITLDLLAETQINKQADAVMLIYLLHNQFDEETKRKTYQYYEKRTWHKSSLSPCIYSLVGMQLGDHKNAYDYFKRTAYLDLTNNQGNTGLGIHAAATGGTWQSVVFGFGGFSVNKDSMPCISPWLPDGWNALHYRVWWKSNLFDVTVKREGTAVRLMKSNDETVQICVNNQTVVLSAEGTGEQR